MLMPINNNNEWMLRKQVVQKGTTECPSPHYIITLKCISFVKVWYQDKGQPLSLGKSSRKEQSM